MMMITIGKEYGIDFYDAENNLILEHTAASEEDRDALVEQLQDDDSPAWPVKAMRFEPWSRRIERQAIYGVDYGPGSVKRRFGGYVPRSAYQLRGKNQ